MIVKRLGRGVWWGAVGGAVVLAATGGVLGGIAAAGGPSHRDGVRLNQIQVVGSHNSYHLEAPSKEEAVRRGTDAAGELTLEYGHPALPTQFGAEGVRQIELDLFADPSGGLYADPLIRRIVGGGPYDPAMRQPGTKVLHIQDIDYHSNCLALVRCLTQVRDWSDTHAGHVPIAVLLEFKDTPVGIPGVKTVVPPPWTKPLMLGVEREIAGVFRHRDLITPDDVRRPGMTLERSVLTHGWPTLRSSRGKVMFLMDNEGAIHDRYTAGNPSLEHRLIFTNGVPGRPDAAFVKRNDPTGAQLAQIQDLVRRGYLVRTRADADTLQARSGDTRMRDAALASGAQWVSTDYPTPADGARFGKGYAVTLPGGVPARCNPVNGPPTCRAAKLESRL